MTNEALAPYIRHLKQLHHDARHEALCEATEALQALADWYDHLLNSDEAYNVVYFSTGKNYEKLSAKRERLCIKANTYWLAAGVLLDMRIKEHKAFTKEMQEDLK